jgi:hypothetical protein
MNGWPVTGDDDDKDKKWEGGGLWNFQDSTNLDFVWRYKDSHDKP